MVEDKAKELGRLIGQSSEYQALKRSSEALNDDKAAVVLLQDMENHLMLAHRAEVFDADITSHLI